MSRSREHGAFLGWLLDQVDQHRADALIVAGDVFDVASPSAEALASYYGFLADARRRFPELDVVVVGGNHDAPARLDAARAVLDALRIRVVGALPMRDDRWDLDRLIVPLAGGRAALLAVPFLRPRDLPRSRAEARARAGLHPGPEAPEAAPQDRTVEGHRDVYAALVEAALDRLPTGVPLLATGHAYVAGGRPSDDSERKIQMGYVEALPASLFPQELEYVAMGHLHLAQQIGERPLVRYPGSPIPLSMAELDYPHQVVRVDVGADGLRTAALRVPRTRALMRIPPEPAPLEAALAALAALPRKPGEGEPPLVEVRVRVDRPEPRLRAEVEAALEGAFARLVRIDVHRPQREEGVELPAVELSRLDPEEVFSAAHRRARGGPPSRDLLSAFRELLEEDRP